MRTTVTPAETAPRYDLHHVPGLQPFITITVQEAGVAGGEVVLDFWQPATLQALADAARESSGFLAAAMAAPAPQEGDES